MKLKIESISSYFSQSRNINVGEIYEIINSGSSETKFFPNSKTKEMTYLIKTKDGSHIVMYEHEIKLID